MLSTKIKNMLTWQLGEQADEHYNDPQKAQSPEHIQALWLKECHPQWSLWPNVCTLQADVQFPLEIPPRVCATAVITRGRRVRGKKRVTSVTLVNLKENKVTGMRDIIRFMLLGEREKDRWTKPAYLAKPFQACIGTAIWKEIFEAFMVKKRQSKKFN